VLSPITPALFLEPIPYEGEVARTDAPSWRREPRARGRLSLAVHIGGQSVVRTAGEGCANTASPLSSVQMYGRSLAGQASGACYVHAPERCVRARRHVAAVVSQIPGPGARFLPDAVVPLLNWPGLRSRPLSRRPDGKSVARPGSLLSVRTGGNLLFRVRGAGPSSSSLRLGAFHCRSRDLHRRPVGFNALAGRRPIPRALRICVERHGYNSQASNHLSCQAPDGSHVRSLSCGPCSDERQPTRENTAACSRNQTTRCTT
jgi:hypothetical protein